MNPNKKNAENAEKFSCECCGFICSKKSNYDKHISTNKHKILTNPNFLATKNAQKNYQIKQAILVCCSDYATYEKVWSEKLQKGDAVLSVNDIQVICSKFKSQVKIKIIPGGLHDLALSEKSIRSLYFQSIFE